MRQSASVCPGFTIVQQLVAQLSWALHVVLLDKVKMNPKDF